MIIMVALGPTPDSKTRAPTKPGVQVNNGDGPTSATGEVFTISTSNTTNTFHTITEEFMN